MHNKGIIMKVINIIMTVKVQASDHGDYTGYRGFHMSTSDRAGDNNKSDAIRSVARLFKIKGPGGLNGTQNGGSS